MKTKYTHLILLVLLSLSVKQLYGQSSTFNLDKKTSTFIDNAQIECIYEYKVNAPLRNSTSNEKLQFVYKTILQTNNSVSKFWDWHSFKKDSIIYSSADGLSKDSINKLTGQYFYRVRELFTPVIFKNYPNHKITVTDETEMQDYVYTENKPEQKWELNDDTLTVCSYLCNKAITKFGGKVWTAWYCSEIPISDGPWKLSGLPGLILKAEDTTKTHTFEAISIRKSDRPIYLDKNISQIKVDKNTFENMKQKFEECDPKTIFDISLDLKKISVIVIGEVRLLINRTTVYCPLEEVEKIVK